MLDRNLITEDLEPEIWVNLQKVLDRILPPQKILHILVKETGIRAVSDSGEDISITPDVLKKKENMLEEFPWADEIRVYSMDGVRAYDQELQKPEIFRKDIDEYLEEMYERLKHTEGISVYERIPAREKHIFAILKKWIREDGYYLCWVTREQKLFFNCILQVVQGRIIRLTTSARYPDSMYDPIMTEKELKKEFGLPVSHAIMDYDDFFPLENII